MFKMFKLFKSYPPFLLPNILNKLNTGANHWRRCMTALGLMPKKNARLWSSTPAVHRALGLRRWRGSTQANRRAVCGHSVGCALLMIAAGSLITDGLLRQWLSGGDRSNFSAATESGPYYVAHRGLLWEVNGGRIAALDCHRAIIEIASGDRRAYQRQALEVGRVVLAWELSEDSG
jgi:hypothetical protein